MEVEDERHTVNDPVPLSVVARRQTTTAIGKNEHLSSGEINPEADEDKVPYYICAVGMNEWGLAGRSWR